MTADVLLAQAGDTEAFTRLVLAHQQTLFRIALRTVGDRGDAEDVVQDSLVLAWRQLPALRCPEAFRAWLCRATVRQALNTVRARARRRTELIGALDDETLAARVGLSCSSADRGPAAVFEAGQQRHELAVMLRGVPVELRVCWVLRELHGLTYAEIAQMVDVSTSTVRGRIARARAQLATSLAAQEHQDRRSAESVTREAA